jgi:hypothetical protein
MDCTGFKNSYRTGMPLFGVSRSAPIEGVLSEHPQPETSRGVGARSGTVRLVDHYPIFRDGLHQVLAQNPGLVVGFREGLVLGVEPGKPRLTGREKDWLRLVAAGQRKKETAQTLAISPQINEYENAGD